MGKPLVTIGIPFHNAAGTLADAVRCIFAQSYRNWELILACDGPTDGGDELARRVDDPRVRVIGDGRRRLLAYRLNQIVGEARGEMIARMDADDLCDPDRIRRQVDFLVAHPAVDVVGTERLSLAPGDLPTGRRREPEDHEQICRKPLVRGIYMCHPSVVGRTGWFRRHPYPVGCRAEDAALWVSSWRDSRFANIPEPLYFYREYESFDFRKYSRIKSSILRIIWDYGRRTHSLAHVLGAMAFRVGQIAFFGLMTGLGVQDHLIRRRSRTVDEADRRRFERAMRIIRATRVPGLD
jgi:glycosyltransferase involved in cell wall biosynthesis